MPSKREMLQHFVRRRLADEHEQGGLALTEAGAELLHHRIVDAEVGKGAGKGAETGSKDGYNDGKKRTAKRNGKNETDQKAPETARPGPMAVMFTV